MKRKISNKDKDIDFAWLTLTPRTGIVSHRIFTPSSYGDEAVDTDLV